MRILLVKIIIFIGRILSYIYPITCHNYIKSFLTYIYTGYQSRRFKHWGNNSVIYYTADNIKGPQHISIGNNTIIEKNARLTAWTKRNEQVFNPNISIGNNCHIGANAHITAINSIVIGDNLLTGTNVFISDNSHGKSDGTENEVPPVNRPLTSKNKVSIGNNVWIGNNVCILSGVKIGDNSIIAANSVVTKNVESNSIYGGLPSKKIKSL